MQPAGRVPQFTDVGYAAGLGDDHTIAGARPLEIVELTENIPVGHRFVIVETAGGEGIGHQYATIGDQALDFLEEFPRQQMLRDVLFRKSIQQDEIVLLALQPGPLDEHPRIHHMHVHARRFAKIEIFLGDLDDGRINLDDVDLRLGKFLVHQ